MRKQTKQNEKEGKKNMSPLSPFLRILSTRYTLAKHGIPFVTTVSRPLYLLSPPSFFFFSPLTPLLPSSPPSPLSIDIPASQSVIDSMMKEVRKTCLVKVKSVTLLSQHCM